jgi:putative transposase
MSDALSHGTRFRTFNILDDFNREVLAIEVDTSLRTERVIRVLDRLKAVRALLPHDPSG